MLYVIIKFMDACYVWKCDPSKFKSELLLTLSSRIRGYIQLIQQNKLLSSTSNRVSTQHYPLLNKMQDAAAMWCE
jgi:hypothetical protein